MKMIISMRSQKCIKKFKNKVRRELVIYESFSIMSMPDSIINPSYDLPYSDDEDFSEAERHNDKKIKH